MTLTILELISKYTDIIGRASVYPSDRQKEANGIFDSNNALLYTGERAILMHLAGLYDFHYQTQDNLAFSKCFARSGLLSRHPHPYRYRDNMRPLSFDEVRGFFMAAAVNPQLMPMAKEIIKYGELNHWNFNDQTGEEFKGAPLISMFKTPVETFRQWKAYRARAEEIGLDKGGMRKAAQEFKYLNPLFFWTQPHSRAFYKAIAGESTTLWERLYFFINTLIGAFQKDDGQNSSRIMEGFMLIALNKVYHNSLLISLSRIIYHWSCRYHFGKRYMYKMMSMYFKDKNNPLIALSYDVEVM